ncbi:transposase is116/is110/is902 family protein (plasmid) [Rhodococcus opacus]|uniref:Transposase is116/is110/is902 family protein n=1 Tax=Rhodococcus opacus TaxID=37919 RepID=A0A1B1KIW0_RHOOP|nr:IS110 family transposase [Rhodococcus opacus]ANS32551.1 transposase is116/is110/is902 family protein [Rhodococcus opacus]ANS32586.1 transposase is116/is110/is902 family protein [Rhodococcus opacus]
MIVIGIDAHKRTHTAVVADQNGSQLSTRTIRTTSKDHLALLRWGAEQCDDRMWAIEDCRHLSRRLERDLLAAGERVVRVPPKLMANVRNGARTYGKSDPIDALAVARAALREPNLPEARLDGMEREVRLLVDHRDDLVAERTRIIGRLRWHLHELDPGWTPPKRLDRASAYDKVEAFLSELSGLVSDLAARLVDHLRRLTVEIKELATEITTRITVLAPSLLAIPGCAPLTAAKLIGETAGVDRFRSKDAFARHNGTAPLPVWSSNRARHRLSRTGNRRLNAAIHIIALTQAHCHDDARALLSRRKANGDGGMEALRILKRRLSDVVYRAMLADRPLMGSATAA